MEAAAELGLMLELLLLVLVLELVVVLVATVDKCRTSTRSNLPLVLGADMVRLPGVGRGIGERAGKGVRKAICNAPNAERRAPLCPAMHGYAQLCPAMHGYALPPDPAARPSRMPLPFAVIRRPCVTPSDGSSSSDNDDDVLVEDAPPRGLASAIARRGCVGCMHLLLLLLQLLLPIGRRVARCSLPVARPLQMLI